MVCTTLPDDVLAIYGDFSMASSIGVKRNGLTLRGSADRAMELDAYVWVATQRMAFSPQPRVLGNAQGSNYLGFCMTLAARLSSHLLKMMLGGRFFYRNKHDRTETVKRTTVRPLCRFCLYQKSRHSVPSWNVIHNGTHFCCRTSWPLRLRLKPVCL